MRLKLKTPLETETDRESFAVLLASIIVFPRSYQPYKPDALDSFYFTIDEGNNWKVKFSQTEPDVFEVYHRYQNSENKFEEALAGWLCYKFGIREQAPL